MADADLLEAIWTLADADVALASGFGRPGWLWREEGPRGESLPYAVMFEVGSGEPESNSKGGGWAEVPVQINVFGDKPTATALGAALDALLDPDRPSYAALAWDGGYEMTRWKGQGDMTELDPDRGPRGEDVWVRRINYVFLCGKP